MQSQANSPQSSVIPYTAPLERLEWVALIAIFVLAALLRLGAPSIFEFKRDEANLSYMSRDLALGRNFPLLGIDSSVGIPNAPVSVYIMALPYLFTSDPTIATLFVGLLNVIGVGFAYALTRRYYGPIAAWIAGLMYAVSPWAIIFSRKIWAQDLLPMFVLLTIGTAILGFIEGKRWAQLAHLPLLAFTGQIHYGAFVLIPVSLYLIIAGRKRWTRSFAISFVITALVITPYVLGAVRAGLLNPATFKKIGANSDQPHTLMLSGEAIHEALLAVAGTEIHSVLGTDAYQDYLNTVPDVYGLLNLLAIAVLFAAAYLLLRNIRRRDQRTPIDIMLLIWLLFPALIYSITWTPMYVHYLIPMIPAAFIVLGAAVSDLWAAIPNKQEWDLLRARVAVFGGAGLVSIAAVQAWLMVAMFGFLSVHTSLNGFGVPLGFLMPIRSAILAQHPQNVIANLDGQYIGYHEETTIWNFLLYDVPSVRFIDEGIEVYPQDSALYFSHKCGQNGQDFPLREGEGCYAITTRSTADFDTATYKPVADEGQKFTSGIHLLSYKWSPTDQQPCLSLAMTPLDGARPEDFNFAVHFINAQKTTVANADSQAWRGRYWRQGDIIVNRFCLQAGDDAQLANIIGVQIGMYTYQDLPDGRHFNGLDVLDKNGTPIGQSVEIDF